MCQAFSDTQYFSKQKCGEYNEIPFYLGNQQKKMSNFVYLTLAVFGGEGKIGNATQNLVESARVRTTITLL